MAVAGKWEDASAGWRRVGGIEEAGWLAWLAFGAGGKSEGNRTRQEEERWIRGICEY